MVEVYRRNVLASSCVSAAVQRLNSPAGAAYVSTTRSWNGVFINDRWTEAHDNSRRSTPRRAWLQMKETSGVSAASSHGLTNNSATTRSTYPRSTTQWRQTQPEHATRRSRSRACLCGSTKRIPKHLPLTKSLAVDKDHGRHDIRDQDGAVEILPANNQARVGLKAIVPKMGFIDLDLIVWHRISGDIGIQVTY